MPAYTFIMSHCVNMILSRRLHMVSYKEMGKHFASVWLV